MVPHTNIILSISAVLLVCSLAKRIQETEIAVTLAAEGISNVSFAGAAEQNHILVRTNSSDELQGFGEIGTAGNCAHACKRGGYPGGECQISCDKVLTFGPVNSTDCGTNPLFPRVCCCFKAERHLDAHKDIQAGDPFNMVKKSELVAHDTARAKEAQSMPNPLQTAGNVAKTGVGLVSGLLGAGSKFVGDLTIGAVEGKDENWNILTRKFQWGNTHPEPRFRNKLGLPPLTEEFLIELGEKNLADLNIYLSETKYHSKPEERPPRTLYEQTLEQVPSAAHLKAVVQEQLANKDRERKRMIQALNATKQYMPV